MASVIALTQFVFLTLGYIAVKILTKAQVDDNYLSEHPVTAFLASNGYLLLVIPAVYFLLAQLFRNEAPGAMTPFRAFGVALTVAIALVYGWAIFSF